MFGAHILARETGCLPPGVCYQNIFPRIIYEAKQPEKFPQATRSGAETLAALGFLELGFEILFNRHWNMPGARYTGTNQRFPENAVISCLFAVARKAHDATHGCCQLT